MKVAIVAPPWVPVPPPAYGGTECVLDALARGLDAAGHEVLLFATGDSTCPVPTAWALREAAGTVSTGPATELHHVVHAYEVLDGWKPDVVHDHTLIGPIYGSLRGFPVITTNHGPFEGELGDCYRALSDNVPIIAISHDQADRARGIPIEAVIHHGVDVDAFPEGDGCGGYAAFVGRMSPDKGVDTAVRVAREANVPLKVAAKMREPPERAYFKEQVEPLLGDGIEYVGEVTTAEKLTLLSRATCLLNPIAWPEPFGMVMIEALACGTPVVATPSGSVPEIVTDRETGYICSSESELVTALHQVGHIDRKMCRKTAEVQFSSERMVADHVAVYERIASRARRASSDRA
jgi:glycosyltransferase involved in cell wall biosynthesis